MPCDVLSSGPEFRLPTVAHTDAHPVRWGIVGCGDVCEVKSGPALQKAAGSTLAAVMRRDRAKAEDFARRHGVPAVYTSAEALISADDIDAIYIATPPSSHHTLALAAAAAGKPCLVEKPMALNHGEAEEMVGAFAKAGVPLWVAYYRRALPRFGIVRDLLAAGAIGQLTSIQLELIRPLATSETLANWRLTPGVSGAGLFFDLASHAFDLVDFLAGPVTTVSGMSMNTANAYAAEDLTGAVFTCGQPRLIGTGLWNFNGAAETDRLELIGTAGRIATAVFADADVLLSREGGTERIEVRNPPHVHQPLIQTIVDELRGGPQAPSTGVSGARTSWVLDRCVESYYGTGNRVS